MCFLMFISHVLFSLVKCLFFFSVQFSSVAQLCPTLRPHGLQHTRPPLSITSSWSLLKLMSIEPGMSFNHLILYCPFFLLFSIFRSIKVFSKSWLFASGGQSIRAPASEQLLPMNIQDWLPLGLTGWISLQSKGLLRVFSNTAVQKHQFSDAQLYGPTLTSIHDYWKNHGFVYTDLCRQTNVSAF